MVQPAEPPSDIVVSNAVQQQAQLVVGEGLPYQQQYIIRHEPAPTRNDFQQQQQQQQALHRQQVSYTGICISHINRPDTFTSFIIVHTNLRAIIT